MIFKLTVMLGKLNFKFEMGTGWLQKAKDEAKSWKKDRRIEPSSCGKVKYMHLLEDLLLFFLGFLLTAAFIPKFTLISKDIYREKNYSLH